jgi:cytochrome b561
MNPSTATNNPSDTQHYDKRTIAWHWITALLVLGLWVLGQTIDFFPRGTPRVGARGLHICFGVVLGVVLVLRLAWRRNGGVKLPPAPGLAGRAAVGMHYLLYILLVGMVLFGLATEWVRGDNLFNLFTVPSLTPGNKVLAHDMVELHGLGANILLVLAGLHAAAAIWHHVGMKDGVLRRMLPHLPPR